MQVGESRVVGVAELQQRKKLADFQRGSIQAQLGGLGPDYRAKYETVLWEFFESASYEQSYIYRYYWVHDQIHGRAIERAQRLVEATDV